MTERVLELAETPAHVHVRDGLLAVKREDTEVTVPFEDLAIVIASHPQVTYSQAALAGCAAHGVAFLACDRRHMPAALLLPLEAHHLQTERYPRQAAMPLPLKKRLWQQIVRHKIKAQARVLETLRGEDAGLPGMAARVRSGDPDNVEAQAARRYWQALFADPAFRRDPDGAGRNALLNYGYGVLRAYVARAVCGAGLHPSLGLHHHNRYNAFALADDLMEPLRPRVDEAVARHTAETRDKAALDKTARAMLISATNEPLDYAGARRSLPDALARAAASLARVILGEARQMTLWDV